MKTVLEYLEASAERLPDKTAVTDEKSALTFSELRTRSRAAGSALAGKIRQGEPVAVMMDKGALTLTVFFGIVYAGGCYCLVNPEFPAARRTQILSVLGAGYVITDDAHREAAEAVCSSEQILSAEALCSADADDAALEAVRARALDTDPLYINFTSGSTGVPKGVAVCHRSVIDFISAFTELFDISEEDVIANQAPFDFDVSVKDIYSAMKTGASLVIVPMHLFSQPKELLDLLCEKRVTTMIWAVSALCLITTFHGLDYRVPETVKRVLFSGEVMPAKHLKAWMAHLPEARFVNLYGPTEITCNCTYHEIVRGRDYADGIPIGRAFPNEQVFLLGQGDQEVTKPGETGEICVRGTCLALGYYHAPEQTAKAFVQNPLNPCYPERIYRTGDLAHYGTDGELYFSGRKDFQIKHMGHRIELEEVERAFARVDGVERCCCVFDTERERLIGFYIGTIDKKDLHRQLREQLPVYMVPGALRPIEAFPLTKNGKIDRKALLEMGGRRHVR